MSIIRVIVNLEAKILMLEIRETIRDLEKIRFESIRTGLIAQTLINFLHSYLLNCKHSLPSSRSV
jgi:hypothetical protein